jgi:hypothetical protein
MVASGFYMMRLSGIVVLGIIGWPATLMLEGCGVSCNVACGLAEPTVFQSDTPSPIVKVVADPPCTAKVATTDGGIEITVSLQRPPDAGPPECAIFEWLDDGTELTAHASFWKGDGPCCSDVYANGSVSPFVPIAAS